MAALLTIAQAQRLVLERASRLPAERVPLAESAGRVLAEPAVAAVDLPPFASSAMDGFAARSADLPGRLPISGLVAAGSPASVPLRPGEAVAISTGGVVPDGADVVVPIEDVVVQDNIVEITGSPRAGVNVRPRGGDVRTGEAVVGAGIRVGPAQIGALAAAGVAEVVCARRPRAAIVTTGTELRSVGETLGPGEIYESNGMMLAAALADAGAVAELLPAVADDEDAHRATISRALEADVVVSSGGVSVGPHDLVRRIEAELGVEELFWRVAVKPGKPVSFGIRGATLVFGLPGNPVSSLVGFELLVRPAILALQGLADPGPAFLPGRLAGGLRRSSARDELVRASARREGSDVVLEPLSGQESHMIVRAAAARALVLVPRGEGELEPGSAVEYLPL